MGFLEWVSWFILVSMKEGSDFSVLKETAQK